MLMGKLSLQQSSARTRSALDARAVYAVLVLLEMDINGLVAFDTAVHNKSRAHVGQEPCKISSIAVHLQSENLQADHGVYGKDHEKGDRVGIDHRPSRS